MYNFQRAFPVWPRLRRNWAPKLYSNHVSIQRLLANRFCETTSFDANSLSFLPHVRFASIDTSCNSVPNELDTGENRCAPEPQSARERDNETERELRTRVNAFSDHDERVFASTTQLPPGFFNDVHWLRNLSKDWCPQTEKRLDERASSNGIGQVKGADFSQRVLLDFPTEDEVFASGFWPSKQSDTEVNYRDQKTSASGQSIRGNDLATDSLSFTAENTEEISATQSHQLLFDGYLGRSSGPPSGKKDLSMHDPKTWEASEMHQSQSLDFERTQISKFRGNAGLRRILQILMQKVYEPLMKLSETEAAGEIERLLDESFTQQDLHLLERSGYDISDVWSWGWILLAPSSTAVRRWISFSQCQERRGLPLPPLFIALQLLRFKTIDAISLSLFVDELKRVASNWTWTGPSGPLVIVRLLRHARLENPELLRTIVDLNSWLFPSRIDGEMANEGNARLTHWFNRLLSLIALPTSKRPFKAMHFQQEAQLETVRHMQKSKPIIPITREGYRALSGLQLMHGKTAQEKEWARVKALSWPPWQLRDQMGIESEREYPGKQSRVMKVQQRMQEAGYQLDASDMAAEVLAGRDTDRSPTIQVRRVAITVAKKRPWELERPSEAQQIPTAVWVARVAATRSQREAWMCFCAYTRSVPHAALSIDVYHAMFDKLLADTIQDRSGDASLPGDGREVHLDPVLARDRVYIPEPVPTVPDLYSRMKQAGLKPHPRLLSTLLKSAETIDDGFRYINDSSLAPNTKDIFLSPEHFSYESIRKEMDNVPEYLLASYFNLLSRREGSTKQTGRRFQLPKSTISDPHIARAGVPPISFAVEMLSIADIKSTYVWNRCLEGLSTYAQHRKYGNSKTLGLAGVWLMLQTALKRMRFQGVVFNLGTFRAISQMLQQIQTWSSRQAATWEHKALRISQEVFMRTVFGRDISASQWIPAKSPQHAKILLDGLAWFDLHLMVWHLGVAQSSETIEQVLSILRWTRENRIHLQADPSSRPMRNTLALIRVVLEGKWADDQCWESCQVQVANETQLDEARELCAEFIWATDAEMTDYLGRNQSNMQRLRTKMLSRSTHRAEEDKTIKEVRGER